MNFSRKNSLNPNLSVFLSTIFWGTFWIPVRAIENLTDSDYASCIGFFLAFLISMIFMIKKSILPKRMDLYNVIAAICTAIAIALYTQGILHTSVANAVLLFYLSPVWGIFLGKLISHISFTPNRLIAVLMGLIGLSLILEWNTVSFEGMSGNIMCLCSGFLFAFAVTLYNKGLEIDVWPKMCLIFLVIGLIILFFGLVSQEINYVLIDSIDWSTIYWLVLFSTIWLVVPMWLLIYAVHKLDAVKLAIGMMFEVIVSLLSGVLVANEYISVRQLTGAILVVGASLADSFDFSQVKLGFRYFNKRPKG
jgi:drug/metabolite transporter (DMT)-like permease